MRKRTQLPIALLFAAAFWLTASFLLAAINRSFVNSYAQAWMLSTMLIPGALFGKWATRNIRANYPARVHYWIYALIGVLYLEYVGAFAAYWLIFQWQPLAFPKVLINPVFSLFWIAALLLGEHVLWFNLNARWTPEDQENEPTKVPGPANVVAEKIDIVTNRKRSTWSNADLLYIESLDAFTQVHSYDGRIMPTNKRISQWEKELPHWVRTHRSYLVNPMYARAEGRNEVALYGKDEALFLPLGRSFKDVALERLEH